jgi:hypothetical protein
VLCDRVIERTAKHARSGSLKRFIEPYLIPLWAHARIRGDLLTLANHILSDRFAFFGDDSAEGALHQEILGDAQIALQSAPDGRLTVQPSGLIERLDWIGERVAPDGDARAAIERLAPKLASGQATAKWLNELCSVADQHERRRSRTRNALMHGGPVAESTVEQTLPFTERMANLAASALVEASLDGVPFADAVTDQTERFGRAKAELNAGVAPATALFVS